MRQLESFLWGIISALGALFFQLLIFIILSFFVANDSQISYEHITLIPGFIVLFAFIEELFKYLIIWKKVETYSLEKGFIINSLFVGLGFAMLEFLLLKNMGNLPETQILMELAVIHIGTSGLMGFMVAIKNPNKVFSSLYILSFATLFHASYNILITKREYFQDLIILFMLGFLILYNAINTFRISKKLAQD